MQSRKQREREANDRKHWSNGPPTSGVVVEGKNVRAMTAEEIRAAVEQHQREAAAMQATFQTEFKTVILAGADRDRPRPTDLAELADRDRELSRRWRMRQEQAAWEGWIAQATATEQAKLQVEAGMAVIPYDAATNHDTSDAAKERRIAAHARAILAAYEAVLQRQRTGPHTHDAPPLPLEIACGVAAIQAAVAVIAAAGEAGASSVVAEDWQGADRPQDIANAAAVAEAKVAAADAAHRAAALVYGRATAISMDLAQ